MKKAFLKLKIAVFIGAIIMSNSFYGNFNRANVAYAAGGFDANYTSSQEAVERDSEVTAYELINGPLPTDEEILQMLRDRGDFDATGVDEMARARGHHVARRDASDRQRAYIAAHREARRARDRAYAAAQRTAGDLQAERSKAYVAAHRKEIRARQRAINAAHREEQNAREQEYAAKIEARRANEQAYAAEHTDTSDLQIEPYEGGYGEEISAIDLVYPAAQRTAGHLRTEHSRAYIAAHREEIRAKQRAINAVHREEQNARRQANNEDQR